MKLENNIKNEILKKHNKMCKDLEYETSKKIDLIEKKNVRRFQDKFFHIDNGQYATVTGTELNYKVKIGDWEYFVDVYLENNKIFKLDLTIN